MKAIVEEGCISCGACVGECPEVFRFGDDGLAEAYAEVTAENEEEAKAFVAEIKSKHKQARHNCWGYIIGEIWGFKDIAMMVNHRGQQEFLF